MKTLKLLHDSYFAPLITGSILLFIGAGTSKATTGNWHQYLTTPVILIGGCIIVLWSLIIFVIKRMKKIHQSDEFPCFVSSIPTFGWNEIGEVDYLGLKWVVRSPANFPWREQIINIEHIDIKTPPFCPKCGTEIEEAPSFFGGFIWKCISCKFKKRNRVNYEKEAGRALKIAKAKLRNKITQFER